jgi:hypothetical protein
MKIPRGRARNARAALDLGTTVYAAPSVRHKIINDGPDELKMTWTYLPPGLDNFFAAIGRPREPGEQAPNPLRDLPMCTRSRLERDTGRRSRGELRPRRFFEGNTRADQAGVSPRALAAPEALRATESDRSQKAPRRALAPEDQGQTGLECAAARSSRKAN